MRDYISNTPVASVDNEQILRTYTDINSDENRKASNTDISMLEAIS